MISKILVIIPLVLLSFTLKAQETIVEEEPEETSAGIKRHKYEVGVDLKGLFGSYFNYNYNSYYENYNYNYQNSGLKLFGRINKSKLIPGSVTYRKYAYRFGLRIQGNMNLSEDEIQINPSFTFYSRGNNNFSILAESGYEVQKQFKKFQLYYGADLGLSYSSFSVREYRQEVNTPNVYTKTAETKMKSKGITLSPLVGIKYFLHSRVAVSLESKAHVGLFSYSEEEIMKELTSQRVGLNLWTDPVHAINVSYFFDL